MIRSFAYCSPVVLIPRMLRMFCGYLLEERYSRVQDWLNPVSNAVILVLLAWYVYRVVTFRRHATTTTS